MGRGNLDVENWKQKAKKSETNGISKRKMENQSKNKKIDFISKNSIVNLFRKSNELTMMDLTMNNERNESDEVNFNEINEIEISNSIEHILPKHSSEQLPLVTKQARSPFDPLPGISRLQEKLKEGEFICCYDANFALMQF